MFTAGLNVRASQNYLCDEQKTTYSSHTADSMTSFYLGQMLLQDSTRGPARTASLRTREPTRSTFHALLACLPLHRQPEKRRSGVTQVPTFTCSLDRGLMTEIVRFAQAREGHLVDPDSRLAHGAHWADAAFDQTAGLKMRHEVACQGLNHAIYSLAANVMLDEWTGSDPPGMRYFGASRKDANKVRDLGWSPPPLQNNLPGTEIHQAVRRCLTTMYGPTVPRKIQDYFRDAPTTSSGVPDGLFSNADAIICVAGEEEKLAGAGAVDHFARAVSAPKVDVTVSVFINPETGEPRLKCGQGSVIARYAAQVSFNFCLARRRANVHRSWKA